MPGEIQENSWLQHFEFQLWTALRHCYAIVSPVYYLQNFYHLFYLARLAQRADYPAHVTSFWKPEAPIGKQHASITGYHVQVIPALLIGLFCYNFYLYYQYFFGYDLWRTRQAKHKKAFEESFTRDNPYGFVISPTEEELQTPVNKGLSKEEVNIRRKKYGLNQLFIANRWYYYWRLFFTNPIFMITSLVLHDWLDLCAFCALFVLKSYEMIQQFEKYQDIAHTLSGDLTARATVLCDGTYVEVHQSELVPGDILRIHEGTTITADCRIVTKDPYICVDQFNITGEKTPVQKSEGDMCYYSTSVRAGNATAVVVATGYQTFRGRTLAIIDSSLSPNNAGLKVQGSLRQNNLYDNVLCSIGVIQSLVMVAAIFVCQSQYLNGPSSVAINFALGLIIAGLPTLLTSLVSITRNSAETHFDEHGAFINTPTAMYAENLGGVDILCVDKTGILTKNDLRISGPIPLGCDLKDLLMTAALAIAENKNNLDPIETAIWKSWQDFSKDEHDLNLYDIHAYKPFDPTTKRVESSIIMTNGQEILCTYGAPKAVLDLLESSKSQEVQESYKKRLTDLARSGYRCLGVARKKMNHGWELLGILPMVDPLRHDASSVIEVARRLGISIRMCTGDSKEIATEFSRRMGMGENVIRLDILDRETEPDVATCNHIATANAYAEMFPNHKEKVIRILQNNHHFVAITGDGVADSPALRRADVGISVLGSTEIAMSAADINFTRTLGLAPMVDAVKASRRMFHRLRTVVISRTTIALHLMLFLIIHFVRHNKSFNTGLVILIAILNDVVSRSMLSDELKLIPKLPQNWNRHQVLTSIMLLSASSIFSTEFLLGSFSTRFFADQYTTAGRLSVPEPVAFLQIVLSQHWMILAVRSNGLLFQNLAYWRLNSTAYVVDGLISLLCAYGWIGGHKMSMKIILQVWVSSLINFVFIVAGYHWFTQEHSTIYI